jgi:hypothetical protein
MPRERRKRPGVISRAPSTSVTAATEGTIPRPRPEATTAERFAAYHAAHPEVLDVLVRLAREWVRRTGGRPIGIAALHERARWELALQTGEQPQLTNTYRPFYARLIQAKEPDLADLFVTRRSVADEWMVDPPELPVDDGRLW